MRNVLIMGAAGRDFHNFNTVFRNRNDIRVVAFTAARISREEDIQKSLPVGSIGKTLARQFFQFFSNGLTNRIFKSIKEEISMGELRPAVFLAMPWKLNIFFILDRMFYYW